MSAPAEKQLQADFSSYYLQRTTQELAEDIDKVRNADDFKADSIPFLVQALQQGAGLFSAEDQKRVAFAGRDLSNVRGAEGEGLRYSLGAVTERREGCLSWELKRYDPRRGFRAANQVPLSNTLNAGIVICYDGKCIDWTRQPQPTGVGLNYACLVRLGSDTIAKSQWLRGNYLTRQSPQHDSKAEALVIREPTQTLQSPLRTELDHPKPQAE
ncbi:hypothetical protein G7046_g367 [Stylonectria norvegica]|nr:hypothetical protein G7046_g367 [Stylonectria norvegica]